MADTSSIIFAIGVLTVAFAAAKALKLISIYLLPSRLSRFAHGTSNGQSPWALVTGASDGIGRAFSHELAARGFNVVLHGRNHAKLSRVMSGLQEDHPRRSFRILVADASTMPCVSWLEQTVYDLHLTVLINNAGAGPTNPIYAPLSESSAARVTSNVSLNALFPLHLTRVLLPTLARNAPALVVNISSMADQGFPLLASYSASKQFLMNLTRAVGLEMALQGKAGEVELLGIRVGRVTGVSGLQERPSLFTPDAQTMARAALARVGRGHGIVVGYWAHALQQLGVSLLPAWGRDRVIVNVMRRERASELKSESKRA
ncbi:short chain dehydrogenase [Hirsutella rhossiliensis]|uniref:Short chain dehydrogenase domain-containing protein n=1 Tax=Hirsutella rhossiliensis TaxID=111463 RepID=A0A9P8MXK7_9HYPO|nr:short chain dehydrogenase domain-containing protein [Hirsutella rhossiliensis]KAH0961017.1 short chain dehydrogenase domain-containing protein [Hirsutella rhossiliensis]